jgi:hypothetical protein
MSDSKYLHEQAAAARALAEAAKLQNVRHRHLTSAAVWTQLAQRAERLEEMQASPYQAQW